jgi:TolB-like protein/tetratricopeptide (TPR) repeat protein
MSAVENRAVFLSYASQDAEVVRKICDALRGADVEVWFDQSELVGGDSWDAKIRKQIQDCALFVPVISAATQARGEGYFRIEWRLAAQRTHAMADDTAFLLPIVIDDTGDAEARVPAEFKAVQWTRLRQSDGGPLRHAQDGQARDEASVAAFCARVSQMLTGEARADARPVRARVRAAAAPSRGRVRWRVGALAGAGLAAVIGLGVAGWLLLRSPSHPPAAATTRSTMTSPLSEAQQLVVKIAAIVDKEADASRDDWTVAESMGAQAVKLEPGNADAWAAYAEAATGLYEFYIDRARSPLVDALKRAQQAVSLAPDSDAAKFALANCYRFRGNTRDEAETILRALLSRRPDDRRVIRLLASTLRMRWTREGNARLEEAFQLYERAGALPGDDPAARREMAAVLIDLGRYEEAEVALDRSLALRRGPAALVRKIQFLLLVRHDVPQACSLVETMPGTYFLRENVVEWAAMAWLWRGDAARSLRIVNAWSDEFLANNPKGFMAGQAHGLLQRPDAARQSWREALAAVEKELAATSSGTTMHSSYSLWRVRLLALLGETTAADESFRIWEQSAVPDDLRTRNAVVALVALGRHEAALATLEQTMSSPSRTRYDGSNSRLERRASLRFDPIWNPLRDNPRFEAILAQIKAPLETPSAATSMSTPPETKSVAVLPFVNQSADQQNEFFSDGIAEELLTVLQKIPGLRVAARTSAWSFKGRNPTAKEVGEKLGMAHVVEGSVQKSGSRVKITARLSRAATNEEVWSKSFGPLELTDVFATQSEIAQAVVTELRGRLTGTATSEMGRDEIRAQVQAAAKGGTRDVAAHQHYLQGRFFQNQFSLENVARAVESFRRAVEQDPQFTLAWSALARAELLRAGFSDARTLLEGVERARKALSRALAIDPASPDALSTQAEIQFSFDFAWGAARQSVAQALAAAPTDVIVLATAAKLAAALGRVAEALDFSRRGLTLDPLNVEMRQGLAYGLALEGRFEEAAVERQRVIELNPTAPWVYGGPALELVMQGRFAEAIRLAEKDPLNWVRCTALAIVKWGLKDRTGADAELRKLIEEAADIAAYQIAEIHAYRGEADEAFAWLERARQQRDFGLIGVKTDYWVRNLHRDPRWPEFLRKLGLHDEQLK